MKLVLQAILGFVFSAFFLVSQSNAAGYTGPQIITNIGYHSVSDGSFFIKGNWTNVDNCTSTDKWMIGSHATDTDATIQGKLSVILSAYMAGKPIELYVDGCLGASPIVKGVYLPSRY